ncbi:MAG: hypothetical protein ACRDRL_14520, partial [Sciscionella sp.]
RVAQVREVSELRDLRLPSEHAQHPRFEERCLARPNTSLATTSWPSPMTPSVPGRRSATTAYSKPPGATGFGADAYPTSR